MGDALDPCEAIQIKISDVKSLTILLQSPDPQICTAALIGLTAFSEQGVKQKTRILSTPGMIKTLLELTKSKDKRIIMSSVGLLSVLSDNAEVHPDMKRKELLEALMVVLHTEEQPEILDEAAACIANISRDCIFT
jgi:hypothetical protein